MNRLTTDFRAQKGVAIAAAGRSDNDRTFRVAMRHSRLVRFMRIGIPLAAVAGLAALAMTTWLKSSDLLARLPASLGGLVISGTKITMEQPRLTGFTRDSRPYEIVARAASQDITKPDTMELQEINAKIELQDSTAVEMSALRGVYDNKTETLKLLEKILLTSSNGYEGQLSEAIVDVRRGNVVSEKPVVLRAENGSVLNANRLEVLSNGQVIKFEGGVTMTLLPKDDGSATKKANAQ